MTRESVDNIPHCAGCGQPIEAVDGRHSEWMHRATRYEACPGGGWARPETVDEMTRRKNAERVGTR